MTSQTKYQELKQKLMLAVLSNDKSAFTNTVDVSNRTVSGRKRLRTLLLTKQKFTHRCYRCCCAGVGDGGHGDGSAGGGSTVDGGATAAADGGDDVGVGGNRGGCYDAEMRRAFVDVLLVGTTPSDDLFGLAGPSDPYVLADCLDRYRGYLIHVAAALDRADIVGKMLDKVRHLGWGPSTLSPALRRLVTAKDSEGHTAMVVAVLARGSSTVTALTHSVLTQTYPHHARSFLRQAVAASTFLLHADPGVRDCVQLLVSAARAFAVPSCHASVYWPIVLRDFKALRLHVRAGKGLKVPGGPHALHSAVWSYTQGASLTDDQTAILQFLMMCDDDVQMGPRRPMALMNDVCSLGVNSDPPGPGSGTAVHFALYRLTAPYMQVYKYRPVFWQLESTCPPDNASTTQQTKTTHPEKTKADAKTLKKTEGGTKQLEKAERDLKKTEQIRADSKELEKTEGGSTEIEKTEGDSKEFENLPADSKELEEIECDWKELVKTKADWKKKEKNDDQKEFEKTETDSEELEETEDESEELEKTESAGSSQQLNKETQETGTGRADRAKRSSSSSQSSAQQSEEQPTSWQERLKNDRTWVGANLNNVMDILENLYNQGADFRQTNAEGKTPLDLMPPDAHPDVVRALIRYMGN